MTMHCTKTCIIARSCVGQNFTARHSVVPGEHPVQIDPFPASDLSSGWIVTSVPEYARTRKPALGWPGLMRLFMENPINRSSDEPKVGGIEYGKPT